MKRPIDRNGKPAECRNCSHFCPDDGDCIIQKFVTTPDDWCLDYMDEPIDPRDSLEGPMQQHPNHVDQEHAKKTKSKPIRRAGLKYAPIVASTRAEFENIMRDFAKAFNDAGRDDVNGVERQIRIKTAFEVIQEDWKIEP